LVTENHDSWLGLRLSYAIKSYGLQFVVGHTVIKESLEALRAHGIKVTHMTYLMAELSRAQESSFSEMPERQWPIPPRPQR
jgi:protein-tyrosine-phosphatase